ncbi:MAG TPA: zinc-dependent alcohol dehydrogenase family protein [Smithella sp.]|nr:zinc-dependent alcohol dehydrogenase family protein [Smithella sp.]HRS96593.1 zinc-dependent alcohol dehydrogenase family protein [Smithella sp.]
MKAALLEKIVSLRHDRQPLKIVELPEPRIADDEILVQVAACGVCHTELDEIEGRTPPPRWPVIPGHQVVGRVVGLGAAVRGFSLGERVGIGWIGDACGRCAACLSGKENLCADFKATGRDINGGYAELMAVKEDFALSIPDVFSDVQAAPLLCAGAIGYRSLSLTGLADGQRLGLTGFGASAHLVLKMVRHRFPNTEVFVFARSEAEQRFARELGAVWAGDTAQAAPRKLHAVIDTTPAWKPVVEALKNLEPSGRLVINAIRKEEADRDYLRHLDYARDLWMEKEIKSVANVTRRDIREFLDLAAEIPLMPDVEEYQLVDANRALAELKDGKIRGAKVLTMR